MSVNPRDVEFEISPGRLVGDRHPCFIIAEIGQNHQGDINTAKEMIKAAAAAGADCVKFQKSTVLERFNKKCLARPYDVPQSWGKTYGEHKLFLEFSEESYIELKRYAEEEIGVIFSASGFDYNAIEFLAHINIPFFKVPSPDVGNLDFIEFMAKKHIPMVISSGMQDMDTMRRVYHTVKKYHNKFALLQCTSAYPVTPKSVNLAVIQAYKENFPDVVVGYSGHETGTTISLGAVAIGAKVLERHVTLDKSWKGSDHSASLDMNELANLVKQIRILEASIGTPEKFLLPAEGFVKRKLGKSVVVIGDLLKGTKLTVDNMAVKNAEPCGYPPHDFHRLVGATLLRDIADDETILEGDVMFETSESGNEKKMVALILARKGSKGVPGKNIKMLNGLPLIAWSILVARKTGCFDDVWVSTDSDKIGNISKQFGAKYHRRDPATAQDTSSSKEGFLDFINNHPDVWAICTMQCTYPTQNPTMIAEAVNRIKSGASDCVFAAESSHRFRWARVTERGAGGDSGVVACTRPLNFDPCNRPRRQDWRGDVVESGAFYAFTVNQLISTGSFQSGKVSYVLDSDDSGDHVDIDTPQDFVRAEVLIKKHSEKFSLDQMVPESVRKQLSAGEEESNGLYMNGSANGVAGDIMQ